MDNTYRRAYTEILEILRYLPKHEYNKIPKSKIEFYKKYKDADYIFIYDPTKLPNEQNILTETNAIIISLFKDYFANAEQKQKIENILNSNDEKIKEYMQIEFIPDKIFINKSTTTNPEEKDNTTSNLTKYKDNFFKKFIKIISNFFRK